MAKRLEGIHSPFAFDFLQNVVFKGGDVVRLSSVSLLRSQLLADRSEFLFQDLGTGNSRKVRVSDLARRSSMSHRYGSLLARIIAWQQPSSVLELGTSLGIGTAYLAAGNPDARIISIEGCPETAIRASENLHKAGYDNISVRSGDIATLLPQVKTELTVPLFLLFDANHSYRPTIDYVKELLPLACEQSIFVFDDIHWSKEMYRAWKEITLFPQITQTYEFFRMGIVFFNQSLSKEHFFIRY